MTKTCLEQFSQVLYVARILATICGGNLLDPNFSVNFHTKFVIHAINAYYLCTLYTIYVGFVVNGDWKVILRTLSLAGSAIQGQCKLLFAISKIPNYRYLHDNLVKIYEDTQTDMDFLPVLKYRIGLNIKIVKVVMCMYIFVVVTFFSFPVIYYKVYGVKLLIMQFYLPGVDVETDKGFWMHTAVHAFLIILGAFGNFVGDIYIFTVIVHIPLFKDILRVKCTKFNRIVQRTTDSKETLPALKDVAKWHQQYNKYIEIIEDCYFGVIFVQVATSVVSISGTIFCIIINAWPAAFAYLMYSFVLLYAYCYLGHLVELSNDEVIDIFYSDCLWYELSVTEQKIVLLMLRKAQSPIELTVGQVMPLSMSTALQLTKAIYSYMMMLLQFLEVDDL